MAAARPKWLIIAALVTMSPDTPGVFELWENGTLVFVGSTSDTTLRNKLARELLESGRDATHSNWDIRYRPVINLPASQSRALARTGPPQQRA